MIGDSRVPGSPGSRAAKVETRQNRTAQRLVAVIGRTAVPAVRLLQWNHAARAEPGWQILWRGLDTLLQCLRGTDARPRKCGST